jgi:hypothetical protein
MVKRHTLLAHDSFPDLPAEVVAASDYDDLSARLAEAEAENARLVSANKARDEFLRGHRYKRSEMDVYVDLCESQMAEIKARLAEAERDAARYRWLIESGKIQHNGTCWFWKPGPPVFSSHDLDAAIDAAMASETVTGSEP